MRALISLLLLPLTAWSALGQTASAEGDGWTRSSVVVTDTQFANWSGTRGTNLGDPSPASGSQIYSSFRNTLSVEKPGTIRVELDLKGGNVYSLHKASGIRTEFSSFTDTQIAANITFLGIRGFQPFAGLAFNLPTGRSALPVEKRFVRMDSDLVPLGAYGEGININPTAGFTFAPNSSLTISPSVGYAFRGRYEQEGLNGNVATPGALITITRDTTLVTPGDMLTASSNLAYNFEKWSLFSTFAYFSTSQVELAGLPVAKQGARYAFNANLTYTFSETFALSAGGTWTFAEKNEYALTGALEKEHLNTNSHLVSIFVKPSATFGDVTTHGLYSFTHRDQNFYDIAQDRFVPSKIKHLVGGGADLSLGQGRVVSLEAGRFWVFEKDGSTFTGESLPPALSYAGWSGQITARFNF